jgi:hypothetical protein
MKTYFRHVGPWAAKNNNGCKINYWVKTDTEFKQNSIRKLLLKDRENISIDYKTTLSDCRLLEWASNVTKRVGVSVMTFESFYLQLVCLFNDADSASEYKKSNARMINE